jgi:glycosyltransferase involved in cell wall biosynthesis
MFAQPPVTWLLPVKNGMPYVTETLASITCQTYKNHTVLARDDGSTDNTLEELQRWIPSRVPGQVFSGPRLGVGRSLAFLVEQAETELCARIDADDVNLPRRLERQVDFMVAHPEVGVAGSYLRTIDETGAEGQLWTYETSDAEIRWLMRYACRIPHPAVMFRRAVVTQAGNYRDVTYKRDGCYEDWDLWQRMSTVTEMRNLPEVLVHYRRTAISMTGQVQDWMPVMRSFASRNAGSLFPGIRDPEAALELWEASVPLKFAGNNPRVPAKAWHLRRLRDSAKLLAAQCGKPADYFTETECFREQYYHLRRRLLRRWGAGPLLRVREFFAATEA